MSLLVTLGVISIILNVALIIVSAVFYLSIKKLEVPLHRNIVFNLNPSLTDGHVLLIEKDVKEIESENGKKRYLCSVIPRDLGYDELTGEMDEGKQYKIIIEKGHRRSIVKGHLSGKRNIIYYTPKDVRELPHEIKDSDLGRWIEKDIELEDFTNSMIEAVNRIKQNTTNFLIKHSDLPEKIIVKNIGELFSEFLESVKKEDKKKTDTWVSSYPIR